MRTEVESSKHTIHTPLLRSEETREEGGGNVSRGTSNMVLGAGVLSICIATFTLQTEIAQHVQAGMSYQKPYFILWVAHSFYLFLIPFQLLVNRVKGISYRESYNEFRHSLEDIYDSFHERDSAPSQAANRHTFAHLLKIGLFLTLIFTTAAFLWYVSISFTTMAKLTAIYNTACFFAYAFSTWLLKEEVSRYKVLAVFLSITGVVIISLDLSGTPDVNTGESSTLIGDIIACVCASLIGLYEVLYKKYAVPKQTSISFANFFTGIIGTITFLCFWIPIPIFHFLNIELFALPDWKTGLFLLANASMGLIYNACFMIVIALTSPTFAAVGVMLTIPVVAVTDMLVTSTPISLAYVLGGVCIFVGFGALLSADLHDSAKNENGSEEGF
ncbi:hypothetical protein K493DRAFT_338354 [Basidiobolus meristosporus CBS 931.73]|uniref:EamA domain-containing protein n=1 Tax=Basidiobolus meristosporus CBS 931.73 TaxID=1314790 RepID=A0A1Y1Y5J0_9FUNG|nr:hypothetical protein K493DRAFT_338354 [Basidiobolus meristosporus CBS 931.73]|eukprot:ORX93291.1 hypothetical protein K493DRAFT_338354 [Basidiobolus meristosporus CBS 931.73]